MQLLVIQFIIKMLVIVQNKNILFFIKIIRGIIFRVKSFNFLLQSTANENFYCGGFPNCIELDGVDGKITLRWIFRKWNVGGMDRIELVPGRDRWRAVVNAVMNLLVP